MTVQPDQSPLVDNNLPMSQQGTQARLTAISSNSSAGEEEQVISLAQRVQEILASHPPLTAAQRARIVALLRQP